MDLEKLGWQAGMFSSYDRKGGSDDVFAGIVSQLIVANDGMESYSSKFVGGPNTFMRFIHASVEHGTNNTIVADYKSVGFYYLKYQ